MSDANTRVGDTLRIAMDMIESGAAFCVLGNHEANVEYWLRSRDVKITHGLDKPIADFVTGGADF